MAKNRMELIESWMASAETPAAVYDDERNERERKQNRSVIRLHFSFRSSVFDRARRETRERMRILSYLYPLLIFLFFSPPLKKPKRYLPLPLFPPVFVLLFFLLFCARKHFQQHTMDNKSEILEQKKQSEMALASARANAEQR